MFNEIFQVMGTLNLYLIDLLLQGPHIVSLSLHLFPLMYSELTIESIVQKTDAFYFVVSLFRVQDKGMTHEDKLTYCLKA